VTPLASVITHQRERRNELMDVRRMFEPAVARAAADRRSDDDGVERGVLARATRNHVVVRIMETLNDLLVESRKLTLRQKGRPEVSLAGHERIVSAIRERDPDAAASAMRHHIDQIAELFEDDRHK